MEDNKNNHDLIAIHDLLVKHFNESELKDLCFRLGFSYEDLGGTGRSDKAREMVTYLNRRGRLPELQTVIGQLRPEIIWPGEEAPPLIVPDPKERWQLTAEDFARMVTILQQQPRFATDERRLDFLNEAFAGSPRKKDIMGLYNVNGASKGAAIRLVNQLVQFGQDIPGRETLGLLILTLLADYGEHPDAYFLRDLLERYPLGVQVEPEAQQPKLVIIAESSNFVLPSQGERFLKPEDRSWLANTIGNMNRFQDLPGRRNLLIDSQIPDGWIGEISLDRGGTVETARTVINDLESRGSLPNNPQKHALGGLLEALLNSLGIENARRVVAILFRYRLNSDHTEMNALSQLYGVPAPLFVEDKMQQEVPIPVSLPDDWQQETADGRLEALYANGQANWLDVEFLVSGARAAQSVCRLEWNRQGEGSGFLVAPDLILTNYHVIMPPGYQGALETRLRTCQVRFGAAATPEGGVSAGNRVIKLQGDGLVAFSEIDKLDFALLRLKEPVEDNIRISRAVLSEEGIYPEQYANIIQHPLGGAMKVSLRYNQIVKILPQRIYYLSDTQKGSSGAPVFDDEWQVIALHRAAGLKDDTGEVVQEANEGVPILDILSVIRPYLGGN